jgi:hypothetical protein
MVRARLATLTLVGGLVFGSMLSSGCCRWWCNSCCTNGNGNGVLRNGVLRDRCCESVLGMDVAHLDGAVISGPVISGPVTSGPAMPFVGPPPTPLPNDVTPMPPGGVSTPPRVVPVPQASPMPYTPTRIYSPTRRVRRF